MDKLAVPDILSMDLIHDIFDHFRLPLVDTHHGPHHWSRVLENGLAMAAINGANPRVIAMFAIFHDSCRWDEDRDPGHGPRGAKFALQKVGHLLSEDEARLLKIACKGHQGGREHNDITVGTCWDADRLDLGRVGIDTDPNRLITDTARLPHIFDWATKRAKMRTELAYVKYHWLGLYI